MKENQYDKVQELCGEKLSGMLLLTPPFHLIPETGHVSHETDRVFSYWKRLVLDELEWATMASLICGLYIKHIITPVVKANLPYEIVFGKLVTLDRIVSQSLSQ